MPLGKPSLAERAFSIAAGAFTDTSPHNGQPVDISDAVDYVVEVINSLNQAGNTQLQWSTDGGTTWNTLGSAIACAATTNLLSAVATPRPMAGLIRAVYTATVAPSSGSITVVIQKRYM